LLDGHPHLGSDVAFRHDALHHAGTVPNLEESKAFGTTLIVKPPSDAYTLSHVPAKIFDIQDRNGALWHSDLKQV
jgi:hypothetical protein